MAAKIASSKATFGSLTATQTTVDLPKSSGTAVTIACNPTGGSRYAQLFLYADAKFKYAYGETAALATAALASMATCQVLPSMAIGLPIIGLSGYVAILAYADADVTDGLSYCYVEADDGSIHGG